jgi:cytochrome c biogenesis protein CcdA
MSVAFAFLAGGLAILNPCSFAMLPVFLSFYVGAQERNLPSAPSRILQGLLVGLIVSGGFLSTFTMLGLPIALGAGQIARAVPWIGFSLGLAMALFAVVTLAGRRLELPVPGLRPSGHQRRPGSMALFGVAYGVASLSCTLPIFLIVLGAALTTSGVLGTIAVYGGYAAGMAMVLVSLSMGAALLRDDLARTLGRLIPRLRWINGSLLLIVAGYLLYYWGMALFASPETRAGDPVVMFVQRTTSWVETQQVNSGAGQWLLFAAAVFIAVVVLTALWRWVFHSNDEDPELDMGGATVPPKPPVASALSLAPEIVEKDTSRLFKRV